MHKKKIAAVTMAMILSNYSAGTMQVLANEVSNNLQLEKSNEEEASKAVVSKFDLHNSDKLDDYLNMEIISGKKFSDTSSIHCVQLADYDYPLGLDSMRVIWEKEKQKEEIKKSRKL